MKSKIKKIIYPALFLVFLPVSVLALTPNDPQFKNQWYLNAIHAPEAWDITIGSAKVIVAVLDTGAEFAHPDLTDNIWTNPDEISYNNIDDDKNGLVDDIHGWDFVDNQPNPGPDFNQPKSASGFLHGTMIASLIGAVGNNSTDGAGVNWQVSLMPLKVLSGEGSGDASAVIRAIDYAVAKKSSVINLSLIGGVQGEELYRAIQRAYEAGVVVVTAAGNDANGFVGGDLDLNPRYPVCYDGPSGEPWWVIGVAAVDESDAKAPFSDYGFKCVDLSAPGVNMPGAMVYHPLISGFETTFGGKWSGTSIAAPLVTGAVALLKAKYPRLTPKQVYDALVRSADNVDVLNPFYQRKLGSGRLNIARALEEAGEIYSVAYKIQDKLLRAGSIKGVVNTIKIDLDGDKKIETIKAVAGQGEVRIYTSKGLLKRTFLVYNGYKGVFGLTVGDLDKDNKNEIVTVKPGIDPTATVWSGTGDYIGEIQLKGNYQKGIKLNVLLK